MPEQCRISRRNDTNTAATGTNNGDNSVTVVPDNGKATWEDDNRGITEGTNNIRTDGSGPGIDGTPSTPGIVGDGTDSGTDGTDGRVGDGSGDMATVARIEYDYAICPV